MSTLRDQLDEPKLAWIWGTEQIKNCVNGKHEADKDELEFRTLGGERILAYQNGHVVRMKTCKHCNAAYPEF